MQMQTRLLGAKLNTAVCYSKHQVGKQQALEGAGGQENQLYTRPKMLQPTTLIPAEAYPSKGLLPGQCGWGWFPIHCSDWS